MSAEILREGSIKLSWPIYKSGLRILVHGDLQAGSTWAFAGAFHWSLWLAAGFTALMVRAVVDAAGFFRGGSHPPCLPSPDGLSSAPQVGFIIAGVERVSLGPRANVKGVGGWVWTSCAKLMFVPTSVGDPQVRLCGGRVWGKEPHARCPRLACQPARAAPPSQTWASRIILMGYAFLVMILLLTYTAISASTLTQARGGCVMMVRGPRVVA